MRRSPFPERGVDFGGLERPEQSAMQRRFRWVGELACPQVQHTANSEGPVVAQWRHTTRLFRVRLRAI